MSLFHNGCQPDTKWSNTYKILARICQRHDYQRICCGRGWWTSGQPKAFNGVKHIWTCPAKYRLSLKYRWDRTWCVDVDAIQHGLSCCPVPCEHCPPRACSGNWPRLSSGQFIAMLRLHLPLELPIRPQFIAAVFWLIHCHGPAAIVTLPHGCGTASCISNICD